MQNIDFSSLSKPVSDSELKAYLKHKKTLTDKNSNRTAKVVLKVIKFLAIAFAVFILLSLTIIFMTTEGSFKLMSIAPLFIALTIIFAISHSSKQAKIKDFKLHRLATENNLTYVPYSKPTSMDGFIFNIGHSHILLNRIIFPDGTEIANYKYTTGSGKNQQTHHWSYIRLQLMRKVPHMILDSKRNNLFGKISNLPKGVDRSQILSLEGNFDNYFTLFAPKEYETDALYIFTPDVMQALIEVDDTNPYDMEAIDDHFYIYRQGSIKVDNPEDWEKLTQVVQILKPKLDKQTHFYADDNVGSREVNQVSEPGLRLKSRLSIISIISLILIFAYIIWLFASFGS